MVRHKYGRIPHSNSYRAKRSTVVGWRFRTRDVNGEPPYPARVQGDTADTLDGWRELTLTIQNSFVNAPAVVRPVRPGGCQAPARPRPWFGPGAPENPSPANGSPPVRLTPGRPATWPWCRPRCRRCQRTPRRQDSRPRGRRVRRGLCLRPALADARDKWFRCTCSARALS